MGRDEGAMPRTGTSVHVPRRESKTEVERRPSAGLQSRGGRHPSPQGERRQRPIAERKKRSTTHLSDRVRVRPLRVESPVHEVFQRRFGHRLQRIYRQQNRPLIKNLATIYTPEKNSDKENVKETVVQQRGEQALNYTTWHGGER